MRARRPDVRPRLFRRKNAILGGDRPQLHARPSCRGGELVMKDVSVRLADRLRARLRVQQHAHLIGLRAAREEQRRLLAEERRQALL